VIQAAGAQAPVIGVHVDSEDEAEVCYIGRLVSVEEDGFHMQELSPDAEWMREASFFSWDEVPPSASRTATRNRCWPWPVPHRRWSRATTPGSVARTDRALM
jgi:hypothetical protein